MYSKQSVKLPFLVTEKKFDSKDLRKIDYLAKATFGPTFALLKFMKKLLILLSFCGLQAYGQDVAQLSHSHRDARKMNDAFSTSLSYTLSQVSPLSFCQ